MRIVIDAFQAAPAITGTDRVAYNVLRELQLLDQTNDYTIITNAEHTYISDVVSAPNFTVLRVRAKKRLIWLNLQLPGLLRRLRAEVFFSFHNIAGPSRKVCRTVSTLLDVIPITNPDMYHGKAPWLKRFAVSATMKRTARLADAFVMPSWGEGFGFDILEALACGIPVVGSKIDGTREALMDGKLGRLVDPADVQDVRSAILAALGERRSAPNEELQYFSFPQFSKRTAAVVRSLSMSGSAAQIPLTSWGVGARAEAS